MTGVQTCALPISDFDPGAVEAHLRMNLRLLDADDERGAGGRKAEPAVLAESRDLDELRARFGERAARAFAARAADGLGQHGLTGFP